MVLFNFSFYNPNSFLSHHYNLHAKLKLTRSIHKVKRNYSLSYYGKSNCVLAIRSNSFASQLSSELSHRSTKPQVKKRNFWQMLINKYWQETIFISSSNSSLESYTNKLKSTGLSIYDGNDYKSFLVQFSRDLLDRKINLSLMNGKVSGVLNRDNVYVKYKWLKSYHPNNFFVKYKSYKTPNNKYTKAIDNSLPVFVLINKKKQLILAESSEQLSNRRIFIKAYHRITKKALSNKKLYVGLFFVNPEDALEYQNYLVSKYMKSTRSGEIKVVATTLSFYTKMLSKSTVVTEFRLIPDLQEVGNLVYKYRKYRNLRFDNLQRYGHNYFQGQPIYIIQPIQTNKQLHDIKYMYLFEDIKKRTIKYNAIFLNHNTAINAWQSYRKSLNYNSLPLVPKIRVSNLEAFIKTSDYMTNKDQFIFLPSVETFNFIKAYLHNSVTNTSTVWQILKDNTLNMKSLCYRALWSLTTRQPNM